MAGSTRPANSGPTVIFRFGEGFRTPALGAHANNHHGPASETLHPSGHAVVKYHDTDVGFLCPLPLPLFLEEDKGPDHDVLAASGVGGRGRVDAGGMERPARNGAVGHRV